VTPQDGPTPPPDNGLRQILTWTFLALFAALVVSAIGIFLVVHFFG
jgi:hypothetical protein